MSTIFQSILTTTLTPATFFICTAVSVVLGLLIALCYMKTCKKHNAGFVTTIALLPAVVQIVIMLVNGNLGAGVAVAGAFSLVRFRSIPGTAREICMIFIALAAGLATGMGYLAFAVCFVIVTALLALVYARVGLGEKASKDKKSLVVVIPETLNYTEVFDDLFKEYTESNELVSVKTTNMGSLFKLSYEVKLKDASREKEFIDALRTRNGNLEIQCAKMPENQINL